MVTMLPRSRSVRWDRVPLIAPVICLNVEYRYAYQDLRCTRGSGRRCARAQGDIQVLAFAS
jgi:hypothetical protein